MKFAIFSLAEHIRRYNTKYGTDFLENENFGFEYFTASLFEHSASLIKSINEGHDLFLFDEEDNKFNLVKNEALRAGISALKTVGRSHRKHSSVLPYTTEEIKSSNENIKLKDHWYQWIKLQSDILNAETTWNSNNAPEINALKLEWEKQSHLARWNDTAIYNIAVDILPSLLKHHKRLRKVLLKNKHKIPTEICAAYLTYIKDFEAQAKAFQIRLADSMVARLQAYDESNYQYTNPLLHLINKLKPNKKNPTQPYIIKEKEFTTFHSYVIKHGTKQAKRNLKKLSWVEGKLSLTFPTTAIETKDSGVLIVPTVLADDVPAERSWPNWLFRGANLRRALFSDSMLLMSQLKKDIDVKQHFIDIKDANSYLPLLSTILQKEDMIVKKLGELKQPSYTELPFYYFTTNSFIKKWSSILNAQKLKVIEDKLQLAEQMLVSLSGLNNGDDASYIAANLPWTACKHLYELSLELQNHHTVDRLNEGQVKRIDSVIQTTSKLAPANKAFELYERLARQEVLSLSQQEYLIDYIKRLSESSRSAFSSFKEYVRPQSNLLLEHCLRELKQDPFKLKSVNELDNHQNQLSCLLTLLNNTGSEEDQNQIEKQAKKYFLRFLQNIIINNSENLTPYLQASLRVFNALGKNVKWLDKSINEHVEELIELSKKEESKSLFKITCKKLIISLGQSFLVQRMDKELQEFDNALFSVFKNEPLKYEDSSIKTICRIRDTMVSTGRPLEALVTSPSEKILVGLNSSESSHIKDLIKLSAHAHNVKNIINSHDTPVFSKPLEFRKLSNSITQFFAQPKNEFLPEHLRKKAWFKKQYIEAEESIQSPVTDPNAPRQHKI